MFSLLVCLIDFVPSRFAATTPFIPLGDVGVDMVVIVSVCVFLCCVCLWDYNVWCLRTCALFVCGAPHHTQLHFVCPHSHYTITATHLLLSRWLIMVHGTSPPALHRIALRALCLSVSLLLVCLSVCSYVCLLFCWNVVYFACLVPLIALPLYRFASLSVLPPCCICERTPGHRLTVRSAPSPLPPYYTFCMRWVSRI